MEIMDFITTNFGWIMLVVVLIVMLIVGYIADKTDFGHKKFSDKKEDKTLNNVNHVEEIVTEDVSANVVPEFENNTTESIVEEVAEPVAESIEEPKVADASEYTFNNFVGFDNEESVSEKVEENGADALASSFDSLPDVSGTEEISSIYDASETEANTVIEEPVAAENEVDDIPDEMYAPFGDVTFDKNATTEEVNASENVTEEINSDVIETPVQVDTQDEVDPKEAKRLEKEQAKEAKRLEKERIKEEKRLAKEAKKNENNEVVTEEVAPKTIINEMGFETVVETTPEDELLAPIQITEETEEIDPKEAKRLEKEQAKEAKRLEKEQAKEAKRLEKERIEEEKRLAKEAKKAENEVASEEIPTVIEEENVVPTFIEEEPATPTFIEEEVETPVSVEEIPEVESAPAVIEDAPVAIEDDIFAPVEIGAEPEVDSKEAKRLEKEQAKEAKRLEKEKIKEEKRLAKEAKKAFKEQAKESNDDVAIPEVITEDMDTPVSIEGSFEEETSSNSDDSNSDIWNF